MDNLPVGVGHLLYAVPAVVFVLHLEGVGSALKRQCKSTIIFGKFAKFAIFNYIYIGLLSNCCCTPVPP
jgi:hypothetical protein